MTTIRYQLFGHEEQCYQFDNKCHCSSNEPYRLPPETSLENYQDLEPPLNTEMSTAGIIEEYKMRNHLTEVQVQTRNFSRTDVTLGTDADGDTDPKWSRTSQRMSIADHLSLPASDQGHQTVGESLRCNLQDNSKDWNSSRIYCKCNAGELNEGKMEEPPSYDSLFPGDHERNDDRPRM